MQQKPPTTPKPCKTCNKKPRHPNRTECLFCIRKKEREKQKERLKKQKEKEKLKKKKEREKQKRIKKQQKARFSRNTLIKEADRVFSLYIRERDKGKPCITCGAKWEENFQCGHFLSRRHLNTRWTCKNAHGQCPQCNLWGSGEQYLHAQAIEKKYGQGTAESIQKLANNTEKVTDEEILETIRHYYKLLADMMVEVKIKKYYL